MNDVTKRLINTGEQLFDFGIHLGFGLDAIYQKRSNFPHSVESAALALANEWWETSSASQEDKIKVIAGCPEVLNKPNLKVEVEEIIAKYDKKGKINQEETMVKTLETRSPGAPDGAESQGACALPQSPRSTGGAESQGACALPQFPTGGSESQGACVLPKSSGATGGPESQEACALPQSPGATNSAESQGACALPQSPGATDSAESQGACVLPQSPRATDGTESQEACALPPIQNISVIEKSDIKSGMENRMQNKGDDAVKESQPTSEEEEEVVYPSTTRKAERKESSPNEGSATDGEEHLESAPLDNNGFPDMPRPQSQQLPPMQNGGTEVLNHSYAEENAENTVLPKSHDHDNDNDDAEDSTLSGDASDGPTNSDFSSEFDDSYPTQLLNMSNGNNADPFGSNNISKSRGSYLANGTADPKLPVGRQTSEKLGRENTSNLASPTHVHPRSS